ncbi:MAG: hypothetical protein ACYS8X_06735 [Planctomycetota bacterium]
MASKAYLGNIAGWVVSGLMVAGIVLFLVVPVAAPSPSTPEIKAARTGFLSSYAPDVSITSVLPAEPSGSGNAGDDYFQAVKIWRDNEQELDALVEALLRRRPPAPLPAIVNEIIEHVRKGAAKAKMEYVFVHTDKKLKVSRFYRPARELNDVAILLQQLGHFHLENERYEVAIDLFQLIFVMGWHMFEERAIVDMMFQGLGIQQSAADLLAMAYRKQDMNEQAEATKKYRVALSSVELKCNDKLDLLWGVGVRSDTLRPADVFAVAERDADRAWRVQATFSLGILKFAVRHDGDRRLNKRLIEKFMKSDDPLIRSAAEASRRLKLSDFRMLGTPPTD